MTDAVTSRIAPLEELGSYGKYEAGPFAPGYGVTLGNALRRVLLGSLEGAAITAVQITGVQQEFSSLPGVREDVVQVLLNMKKIRLRSFATGRVELTLNKKGAGSVTAGDITPNGQVEIVNPEQVLMTLDSDKTAIEAFLVVERGVGYVSADRLEVEPDGEARPRGVMAVDAIFTPVRKVNFTVENTRVGQDVDREKLILEIETDGTVTPEEAVRKAAAILVGQFAAFSGLGEAPAPAPAAVAGGNLLDLSIEDLDLPMRAYNALKRAGIVKVGQLLSALDGGEAELLKLRNFGQKSLTEVREKLVERGFDVPESTLPLDAAFDEEDDEDDSDEEVKA
jgi:DNA-directed RNA polymerase subunit alpha